MKCTHDVAEMETAAVADGLCPLCMAAWARRLDFMLKALVQDVKHIAPARLKARDSYKRAASHYEDVNRKELEHGRRG